MRIADFTRMQEPVEAVEGAGGHGDGVATQVSTGRRLQVALVGSDREDVVRRRARRRLRSRSGPDGIGVLVALVALAVSTPALMGGSVAIAVPHGTAITLAAIWSLIQIPILVHLVHRHRDVWAGMPADSDAELLSMGARAVTAEAALRRDQERLHELRATVAGIGMTYRLMRDRKDRLSGITRSRLEHLYESELARLERLLADQPREIVTTVDVTAAVEPLVDSLRVRGHRVSFEGPRVFAHARRDDMVEIVHVLLENAVRHAPGSEISLHVDTTAEQVRVRVSDRGHGISEGLAPHVFERGVRAPGSPGEGLGLHVARRLAGEMGGQLRLDPRTGDRGATFTLVLPVAVEPACLARSL